MNWELITALLFYAVLGIIIYKNRKKIEFIDKIFLAYKWKSGVNIIRLFTRLGSWFFKILSTISIPVCLFFMIFGIEMLIASAENIISTPSSQPGISLLIPGVKMPGTDLYVPFWYGIISIVIIAVVHELSHGIISLVEGVKLKSTGVGLFLIFPIAFVEPDESSLKKTSRLSRLRVFCAGSFANILTALLFAYLASNLLIPIVDSEVDYTNVVIQSTVEDLPAAIAGVPNNSYLESINNNTIKNITEFYNVLLTLNPAQNITLTANGTDYYLTTAANPDNTSRAYLGVMVEQDWKFKDNLKNIPELILMIPFFLFNLAVWVSNLNLSVGMFNLVPLWITDGGKILVELFSTFLKEETMVYAVNYVFFFVLSIILFNMFGPALMSFF